MLDLETDVIDGDEIAEFPDQVMDFDGFRVLSRGGASYRLYVTKLPRLFCMQTK